MIFYFKQKSKNTYNFFREPDTRRISFVESALQKWKTSPETETSFGLRSSETSSPKFPSSPAKGAPPQGPEPNSPSSVSFSAFATGQKCPEAILFIHTRAAPTNRIFYSLGLRKAGKGPNCSMHIDADKLVGRFSLKIWSSFKTLGFFVKGLRIFFLWEGVSQFSCDLGDLKWFLFLGIQYPYFVWYQSINTRVTNVIIEFWARLLLHLRIFKK